MSQNDDLFGAPTGGGNYPAIEELEGKLVLIRPSEIKTVPGYQGNGVVDRATADVTVFEDDGSQETFDDMYLNSAGIVPSCRKALKPGAKPYVLGRITRYPSKASKAKGINTPEEISKAIEDWFKKGAKGP